MTQRTEDRRILGRRRRVIAFAAGAALLPTALAACHTPGGSKMSLDRATYISRSWTPYTVTLVDTRTEEAVWTMDVPVGEQLSIQFTTGTGPNEYLPDEMSWGVMEAGRWVGRMPSRVPSPPRSARRVDTFLRPAPEYPGGGAATDTPRAVEAGHNRTLRTID